MDKAVEKSKMPKTCDAAEAARLVAALAPDGAQPAFAVVVNPAYVHPPYELYPLARPPAQPPRDLLAIVCDMDGTTTTTEPLCLHSLEYMVRRMTGRTRASQWGGLTAADHPHVIGNSTTRHIEYLLETYGASLHAERYLAALLEAVLWTQLCGVDAGRRDEAALTARTLGLEPMLQEPEARALTAEAGAATLECMAKFAESAARRHVDDWREGSRAGLVRGAIEIYYARYHQILRGIQDGRGQELAAGILGSKGENLIEPMPGIALFLVAAKGLLSETQLGRLATALQPTLWPEAENDDRQRQVARKRFLGVARRCIEQPPRLAVVTSSIRYEAEIVLGECFAVLRRQIAQWPLKADAIRRLQDALACPAGFYDAIVTASDSSEIRLKPHRDLYSLALHRLGLEPSQFDRVLGLEDSESGITAIRAAGVGMSVAVPFAQTRGHHMATAWRVCDRGVPEVMFGHGWFCAG